MLTRKPPETTAADSIFGYLSTIHSPEHGYFGGYLIISAVGRPLEFHCTAPIRPSRAQEILYGPTLHSYLLGEQICGKMLESAKLSPILILCEQAAPLYIRPKITMPMVHVGRKCEVAASRAERPAPAAIETSNEIESPSSGQTFCAAGYELRLPWSYDEEESLVLRLLVTLAQHVDLSEPFGRIHEAIQEAQRIGTRSSDLHGQAA